MSFSNLTGILQQYMNSTPAHGDTKTTQDFEQVSQAAPSSNLASGLAEAFRSNQTPPFAQMVSTLFSNSDGNQRAGILNHLVNSLGSQGGAGVMGALSGLLGQGTQGTLQPGTQITPQQAQSISPDAVQQMAAQAEKSNPSIIDQASSFYAQHPTLVKALGAGSLALIMSHMSKNS